MTPQIVARLPVHPVDFEPEFVAEVAVVGAVLGAEGGILVLEVELLIHSLPGPLQNTVVMRVEKRLLSTEPPVEAVLVAETSEHEDLCQDLVAVANREPLPCQEHVAPSERSSLVASKGDLDRRRNIRDCLDPY